MDIRFPHRLTERLKALAPINSVKIRNPEDRATWEIRFKPEATQQQQDAANAEMLAFVIPDDDDQNIDSPDFGKREKAILLTIGLMQGLTPQEARNQARLKFRQAMQLLGNA